VAQEDHQQRHTILQVVAVGAVRQADLILEVKVQMEEMEETETETVATMVIRVQEPSPVVAAVAEVPMSVIGLTKHKHQEMEHQVKSKSIFNMKTLALITFMTMSLVQVHSQANLAFNQVKNTSGTWTIGQTINNLVVPTGKVLKIESATLGSGSLNSNSSMLVGNHIIYSGYTFYGQVNLFPLWLSDGSYPVQVNCNSGCSTLNYSISGIEFNVVP